MNEENFEKKSTFQSFALNFKTIINKFINATNSKDKDMLAAE